MARLQGLGAQPDSKWQVYGKAEPFREANTGGGAVDNNDNLVAALQRCETSASSASLWLNVNKSPKRH